MCCGVTGLKKTFIVVVIIAALSNGAVIVHSVQTNAKDPALQKSIHESDPSQLEIGADNGGLFERDSGFTDGSNYASGQGAFFLRTMLAIVFVVVLGAAAIYVSKKLLPQIARVPGKEIRIVETVHLGPRRAVHLIDIGHRRFLIGSTNENVTRLADMTEGRTGFSEQEAN